MGKTIVSDGSRELIVRIDERVREIHAMQIEARKQMEKLRENLGKQDNKVSKLQENLRIIWIFIISVIFGLGFVIVNNLSIK